MLFNRQFALPMDYTKNYINIDTLCDALSTTEEDLGIDKTFELKKEHQKASSDRNHNCSSDCNKCKKGNDVFKDHPYGALMKSLVGGYDDDEDDFYMCEMCTGLTGYKKKYNPVICDACTLCETCDQYLHEECSGCSYSTYRDGTYYRDKVDESEILDQDELDAIKDIQGEYVSKRRLPMERFSIKSR